MNRIIKTLLSSLMVCLLIFGSAVGTSAYREERIDTYNYTALDACSDCVRIGIRGACSECLGALCGLRGGLACTDNIFARLRELCEKYIPDPYRITHDPDCAVIPEQTLTEETAATCPTEAHTEAVETLPAEAVTEAPTEAPETVPTESETQPPVEAVETVPTEPATQPPTQTVSEAPAQVPETEPAQTVPDDSYQLNEYELEVVRLINEIRAQNGLGTLGINVELSRVARIKAQDMRDNRYFDHNSPVYGSPFDMMKSFGIRYRAAGENIAYGYSSPQSVVNGWMNSDGHRRNILNPSFTQIGMGYTASGNFWSQMFIG